ncbi:MAG: hypothetical protein Q9219_006993 [cf. Caloplaca sp. 3 TL-2023]
MLVAPLTDAAVYEAQQIIRPDNGPAQNVQKYEPALQQHQTVLSVTDGVPTVSTAVAVHEAWFNEMSLGKALELAKAKATELELKQVASDIESWVEHHPWKAAFYTASAVSIFAPEILSLPALEALGFGLAGVRAGVSNSLTFLKSLMLTRVGGRLGSLAAKIQSVIGPVAARSVFAIWQSARMGGYGVEYVNGGVRALVALTDAAVAACNPLKDCKGLISDGGGKLLDSAATTALAVLCGCLTSLNTIFG